MITQERLHELFEYREDGILVWKVSKGTIKKGKIVGSLSGNGYLYVSIDSKLHKVHRMIFLYHHGYLTNGLHIDHIDCDPLNNRIENLREVTPCQNQQNGKLKSNNTSGIKGVYWNKAQRKWHSRIKVKRKQIHLGYYDTIEEAEAVVKEAREKYHGEYARHE